ncbi:cytochrome c [Flavihumibacter sp. RY-1]|uniref:Cytochrome c n=1 Tax=Flavihumibacter fluminis TaxID=2909236 RepID=A0ABS9BIL8_9BACT|nr:cytochrome c [Flavihumibacter fluminis]MCF1715559.1 cytochrome c [Flavihumibacter fluminis]
MNKKSIIAVVFGAVAFSSCSDVKRTPGKIYMPDMAYSRAVETYNDNRELQAEGINYNAEPVAGTVARGEEVIYRMLKDTTGTYVTSAALKNPLTNRLTEEDYTETERLYLINCGICHGSKLDGNGPLYNDGKGPYPLAPKNLVSDEIKNMADGTIFHSITYGKNLMGSYASHLTPKQRWMMVQYIRMKQNGETPGAAATDSTTAAAPAGAATAMK